MRRITLPVAILAAAAVAVGCDKDLSPTGPAELPTAMPFTHIEGDVCYNISFDDQGFVHGSVVTSLTTPFGFAISVTVDEPGTTDAARTYNTNHVGGPDFDLEWNGASARCAACNGQGKVLVIEGRPSWEAEGDSPAGGDIILSGFAGNGDFYIEEFKGLDQEPPPTETAIEAYVDGNLIGASTGQGDGSVETIVTAQTLFNTSAVFSLSGSGAVDDILVCRVEENGGGEGCTPGYWKQEQHFDSWVGYAPTDLYCNVFGVGPCITLLAALEYVGGGGYGAFLRHSVAALLNATSPDVDYDLSPAEVIAFVQDTFASGDFEDAKDELEEFNEQFCPLD